MLRSKTRSKQPRVLVVRDTRISGEWILNRLAKGLRESGVDVYDAGVLSTPSVAYLVKARGFSAGVVISASHNPPEFNGIKFFTPQGCKWPDAWEHLAENYFYEHKIASKKKSGAAFVSAGALHGTYEDFLLATLDGSVDYSDFRIALDCSNGANSHTAPDVFRRMGAIVYTLGASPNGRNINVGCGSQHTEKLSELVRKKKCHLGIAFDGDGDRVILVDERGNTLDGDHIISMLARSLKKNKQLKRNTVVITVMANLGLKKALKKMAIRAIEVSVGDRYVSEAMRKSGSILGGEQSGHIIMGAHLPTGDGLLTALHMLSVLKQEQQPLSKLASLMRKYPQVLMNVPVKERTPIEQVEGAVKCIRAAEKHLGINGRVLVRYSGTEPLLRIMIEGPEKKTLQRFANDIAACVKRANGASRN